MSGWRALRALARVEWRQLRRHRGRSWLIVALVALPVAAMAGGRTLLATTQVTPDERRAEQLGAAALRIDVLRTDGLHDDDPHGDTLHGGDLAALPAHARTAELRVGRESVAVPGRRLAARSLTLPAAALLPGGLAAGMYVLSAGRAPSRPDEVALSPALLRALERGPGDSVTLSGGPARVCGEIIAPEDLSLPLVLRAPSVRRPDDKRALLVDLPEQEARDVATALRAAGQHVTLRAEIDGADGFESLVVFVVGGFGLLEAALVIASAFAVGLRRRQHELGLLGATGAPLGAQRAALIASAAWLAGLGALLGLALGVGGAFALHPLLDGWNLRWNGPLELPPGSLLAAALLALVTAVLAAAPPTLVATRLPIREALGGRRPITTTARGWLLLGLGALTVGLASTVAGALLPGPAAALVLLAGSGCALLGFGACSPWVLATLADRAAPLPLSWRLAVRDAGRFRARNGPVVTAVLAGMAISVVLATLIHSIEAMTPTLPRGLPDDVLLVDGSAAELRGAELADALGAVDCAPLGDATAPPEHATAPTGRAAPPPGHEFVPWQVRLAGPVTPDVLERAQALAARWPGTVVDAELLRHRPDRQLYPAVLLLCMLTGLVVIGAVTALGAVESAADARVLHAVGAAPPMLRAHAAARAAYLALLGCVLAIPAGLIPAAGLLAFVNAGVEIGLHPPWPELLAVVAGLPVLAFAGTWLWAPSLQAARAARPAAR